MKYEKDGEEIECWICETEKRTTNKDTTLFKIRVFQSDRYLCCTHLLAHLMKGFGYRLHKNPRGVDELLRT